MPASSIFFLHSTGGEQHQFRPDCWVPTKIGLKVNRDREQLVNFVQLCKRAQERRRWKEEFKCETGKVKDRERRRGKRREKKRPMSKVGVAAN